MINRIRPHRYAGYANPFTIGTEQRSIKVTFHSSSLVDLPEIESEALNILYELSEHVGTDIEACSTSASRFPVIEVQSFEINDDHAIVTLTGGNSRRTASIMNPSQWLELAAHLTGIADHQHPTVQMNFSDVMTAMAHIESDGDILITFSPILLENRSIEFLGEANSHKPSEAAKIIGLFLRSREKYLIPTNEYGVLPVSKGAFYWTLARHRLPNMWRYNSACHEAGQIRGDNIAYVSESILIRCARSLEARDLIGVQFYFNQNNGTRDAMAYHFDYLTLLLSGAIDAQAVVVRRSYNITRRENYASFRNRDFRRDISRAEASDLHNFISGQYFRDVTNILSILRNTIHSASFSMLAVENGIGPQESYIRLPTDTASEIFEAAERCGSAEEWGLIQSNNILLEPFTFATNLINKCFEIINEIAHRTNVDGLFMGNQVPDLPQDAPNRDLFVPSIRERISLLG